MDASETSRENERKAKEQELLPRILLIDDEPLNLEVLGSLLLTLDYESDKAFSGAMGLHMV